jgi:hypothetical protein
MKNVKEIDRLIEKRWPKLKRRAQNERNPGKLITILEEIEDMLFLLEMRIAAHHGSLPERSAAASRSAPRRSVYEPGPGDSELRSQ